MERILDAIGCGNNPRLSQQEKVKNKPDLRVWFYCLSNYLSLSNACFYMSNKNTYKLNEEELRGIIKEAILEVINENQVSELFPMPTGTYVMQKQLGDATKKNYANGNGIAGISFGIKKKKINQQKIEKYSSEVPAIGQRYLAIDKELERRRNLYIQNHGPSNNASKLSCVKEGVSGAGTKLGMKFLKYGQKAAKIQKVMNTAEGITFAISMIGVPEQVSMKIDYFKNPNNVKTAKILSETYTSMSESMQAWCMALKNCPEMFFDKPVNTNNLQDGPERMPIMNQKDALNFGIGGAFALGMAFLGPVGWIYDALDIVGTIASARADSDEMLLEEVENQRKYLLAAISEFEKLLNQTK